MLMRFWKADISYRDYRCSELDFCYDRWKCGKNTDWVVYEYVWDGNRFHYTGTCKSAFGRMALMI